MIDETDDVAFDGECPIGNIMIGEQNVWIIIFDIDGNEIGSPQGAFDSEFSEQPDVNEAGEVQVQTPIAGESIVEVLFLLMYV